MNQERRFNPYFNPDFIRSLEQKQQVEKRRRAVEDKLADAQDAANIIHVPVRYVLLDRRSVIVTPQNRDMLPQESNIQSQGPTGQK
jgi:hypothetical protein